MEPLVKHPLRFLALAALLFSAFGCQSAANVLAPSPITTPLSTQTIIPTPIPTLPPTPTTEPTPTPPATLDTLQLSPADYAADGDEARAAVVYAVKILDHLHTHPDAPERPALLERLVNVVGYRKAGLAFDWLISAWLRETILPAFNAAGGLPAGWEALQTDLDNDGQPDYVMSFYFRLPGSQVNGDSGLYWIVPADGQFVARKIAILLDTPHLQKIEALGSQDFDEDGQNDLAYTTVLHDWGEFYSTIPHLVTRQGNAWQKMTILPDDVASSRVGSWSVGATPNGLPELIRHEAYRVPPPVDQYAYDYQIHFRYVQGAFIPVNISPSDPNEQAPEWADLLALNGRYAEALAVLQSGPQDANRLYHAGLAYLFAGDVAGAQAAWESLLQTDPGAIVQHLLPLLQQPDSLWRVCAWLDENAYPYQKVLCGKKTLIPWQSWTQAEPLDAQAARLGLSWQMLSGEYDLNGDGSPDPLGLLDQAPWVFLSTPGGYTLFFAAQSLPPGTGIADARFVDGLPDEDILQILVSDLDANQRPEIVIVRPDGFTLYEWLGYRFAPHEMAYQDVTGQTITGQLTLAQPVPGDIAALEVLLDSDPMDNLRHYELIGGEIVEMAALPAEMPMAFLCPSCAIEALFGEQNPQGALEMLQGELPTDPWQAAEVLYLQGLAAEYSGDTGTAFSCYEAVASQYPDTAWAQLAQEKLAQP